MTSRLDIDDNENDDNIQSAMIEMQKRSQCALTVELLEGDTLC